jgi:hypothetical protein
MTEVSAASNIAHMLVNALLPLKSSNLEGQISPSLLLFKVRAKIDTTLRLQSRRLRHSEHNIARDGNAPVNGREVEIGNASSRHEANLIDIYIYRASEA